MDELSSLLNDQQTNSKGRRGAKRKTLPPPVLSSIKRRGRPPKQSEISNSSLYSDEGIGSSLDPLNESIAESVKRRKRVTKPSFDSKYFLDSVVNQIERKYKNKGKDDAIIDLQNLEIIDKKGFVEKRIRTEFGYFAENTLEDLRQNSFRNKDLNRSPLIESTPQTNKRQTKVREETDRSEDNTLSDRRRPSQPSTSRAIQMRNSAKLSVQPLKKSMTDIVIASDNDSEDDMVVDNPMDFSDEVSVISDKSEELDDSHPLLKYENRTLLTDREYQIIFFKKTIELLKNDKNNRFKEALKSRAIQTIGLPGLPSGPNVIPIIRFNRIGEPNFEFHFLPKDLPLDITEILQIDREIVFLSKTIYESITFVSKQNNCQKKLNYKRRELQFNN